MRTGPPSSSSGPAAPASPLSARSPLWGSALATAVGRQLLGQATVLLPLLQELLAVLRREGPSTEGIFRKAASGTELRELREALDRDADVDLGNQPALLLAAVLKVSASDLRLEELLAGLETSKAHPEPLALQDFLRSIPDKLLVTHLYEDWMAAMERTSKEEKVSELKAVAEKLPAANLFLLKRLLSLLQHIGRNAATSRMSCSNLAICLGPNLLSPPDEDLLPLQAMLEVTEKVRCVGKPAAALPAYPSLAAQRSLAASSLEQMPVGWLPAKAAPQPQPSVQRQGSGVGKAAWDNFRQLG
ncbi:T-cell activation Rho GTPase-activating protein-like [Buteo buteo]|uniref:T-cell activation Rho GTPase-activating protein-like n=1 Tax=Buteo buteo TaxID=30397 RepID=UPI003EBDC139